MSSKLNAGRLQRTKYSNVVVTHPNGEVEQYASTEDYLDNRSKITATQQKVK